jgi:uncharacterized integral membrane protein
MNILFRIFVILPIAIILLLFALANRHFVTVSFDPFPGSDIQGPEITAPLFIALTLAALGGVFAGGFVVWLRQGRWRRAARTARNETDMARAEADRLRADLAAARRTPGTVTGTALVTSPARRDAA